MKELLNSLEKYSTALEKASIWHSSKEVLKNVKSGNASYKKKKDYVYEFYCYIRLLLDLKKHYKLAYCEGTGKSKNKFPKGPCKKKGKPFFQLLDKNNIILYQICEGSEIKVKCGNKFDSPDISFQTPNSPETPSFVHVKVIMDAKNCDVKKGQFNYFSTMIRNLGVENAENENIIFDKLKDIRGNCLISYNSAYTDDIKYLKFHNLCEIEYFNPKDNHKIISS